MQNEVVTLLKKQEKQIIEETYYTDLTLEEFHTLELLVKAKKEQETFGVHVWYEGCGLYIVNIAYACDTTTYQHWERILNHFGVEIYYLKGYYMISGSCARFKRYAKALEEAIKQIVNVKDLNENKRYYSKVVQQIAGAQDE